MSGAFRKRQVKNTMSEISNKIFCFMYTEMSYFGKYQNFSLPSYTLFRFFFSSKNIGQF